MKTIKIFSLLFSLFAFGAISAQDNFLDQSFGHGGKVLARTRDEQGTWKDFAYAQLIQHDGKIIVGGNMQGGGCDILLMRFNVDGSIDSTFGINGSNITYLPGYIPASILCLAFQSDGKIVAAGAGGMGASGSSNPLYQAGAFVLARYSNNGILDSTFGNNGIVFDEAPYDITFGAKSIAIQPDNKIIAVGTVVDTTYSRYAYAFAVKRYNSNGAIDSSFGNTGTIVKNFAMYNDAQANAVLLLPNNKIIAGGSNYDGYYTDKAAFALACFNTDGTIDSSFGVNGSTIAFFDSLAGINSLTEQSDGKIIAGGYDASYFCCGSPSSYPRIARFESNGTLDTSFGSMGSTHLWDDGPINSIRIDSTDKILGFGYAHIFYSPRPYMDIDFLLARFKSDGKADSSFGENGEIYIDLFPRSNYSGGYCYGYSMDICNDGMIVASGYASLDSASFHNEHIGIVRYISNLTTSVFDLSTDNNLIYIYPNPIKEVETLKYTLREATSVTIILQDAEGKSIKTYIKDQSQPAGAFAQEIDMPSDLSAGVYIIDLASKQGHKAIRVVKK